MAHPRGRAFARGKQRLTTWLGPADQGYVSVASGTKVIISFASFGEPATVIRSRGTVSIAPDSFGADVEYKGAIGMGIVSTDAFTAGVASIPGPWLDSDWGGWYVWRSFAEIFEFKDATGSLVISTGFQVDSKAMRKITTNETLVVIAESQSGAYQIFSAVRTLLKLT